MSEPTPSRKSPAMEEALKGLFGFDRRESIIKLECVPAPIGCGRKVTQEEYDDWTELIQAEYEISGLCATCQGEIFG